MPKQFCLRGHDTQAAGRRQNHSCIVCDCERKASLRAAARGRKVRPLRFINVPAEPLLSMLEGQPGRRSKQLDKAIWRARRSGTFTLSQADELCVNVLRLHPAEVYGDSWWAA